MNSAIGNSSVVTGVIGLIEG